MAKKDPRVDAYIAKAAPFARPILKHFRKLVHHAVPQVEETIKWSMPSFTHHGILCGMAAFKAHCVIGFWKSALIFGEGNSYGDGEAMGEFGRLTSLKDLPPDKALLGYIKKAAQLNEKGVKKAPSKEKMPKELVVPADLQAALRKNRRAEQTFDKFSYSHRKEYVQWITDAKRDETRQRRLHTAIEWLAEGKPHNWKYMNR